MPSARRCARGQVGVGLVPDLADDLLEQVLQGHDAVDRAVLVDDHAPSAARSSRNRRSASDSRTVSGSMSGGLDPRADQVVVTVDHRPPVHDRRATRSRWCPTVTGTREWPARGHRRAGLRDGQVAGAARAPTPRGTQDVAHQPLVQVEGAADDVALLGVQAGVARRRGRAAPRPRCPRPSSRTCRRAAARPGRSTRSAPPRPVARASTGRRAVGATASAQGRRSCMASRLGASSPSTRVKNASTRVTAATTTGSAAEPRNVEQRHERLGQRHRRGRRGEEPGQRDADLDRREEPVGVAGEPHQALAARAAGVRADAAALPAGRPGPSRSPRRRR